MATFIAYCALFALFIGTIAEQLNGCEHISGLYKAADRLKLKGVTDEDLQYLPSCLKGTARVFIISVQESNFTLGGLVSSLTERVRQFVVDLEINNCELTKISAGVLSNLPKLRYINLGSNTISVLDTMSFSNMTELQTINLSNNRLTAIQPATFSNLPKLNEISLQNNMISEISRNAFQNVPSLVVIYLDHNRLQALPYSAFRPAKIKFMHASNNEIQELPSSILRLGQLVNLDVRNNSIEHISKDVTALQYLRELHLSFNNLTTLPEEIAPLIENTSFNIELSNNPWDCDCNLLWLISWVSLGNSREDIFCETPQFINMSLFDISELDCTDRVIKAFPRSGYIVLAVVLVLVAIATCATIFYICVWNSKSKSMKRPIMMIVNSHYYIPQSDEDSNEVTATVNSEQNGSTDSDTQQKQSIDKIHFGEKKVNGLLRLGKRLGRGAFGDVFEGLAAESNNGLWKKVAIKRIRDNAASYDSDNLIKEYQQLTDIGKHPNIIQVFGIGKLDGSLIMVMELAENGDMLAHLKDIERSSHRTIRNLDSSEEKFFLENKHPILFLYMWHVAKGMAYLSDIKVVHRDLAARNILLAAGNIAKLSDFGLSRDVYENGYYYQSSKGRLPFKWMSPETLSDGKFTIKERRLVIWCLAVGNGYIREQPLSWYSTRHAD
ncbi:myoblast growth factor receptor egl-15-like [Mercenaria mercenaria]|uniref:myoblast growth factor receptor egl-15-like n=1 Tax=Mercenaria mercenaria TaxID=6596 RepID=UPI00234F7F76|nr:myoblast growth factor receptor egl-15-like [Mercenaria mercenaria]